MDFLRQLAAPFFTLHQSLRKNAGIAVALAASAAVVTACALILPAATMDRQDRSTSPSPRLTAAQQEHLRCDQKNRSATKGGGWSPGERSSTKTGSNDSSVSPAEKSIPTDAHAAEKHRTPGGTKKTGGTASGASATSSTGSDAMKNAASAGSVTHEGDAGQTKADAGIQSAGSAKNQKTTKESAGTEPSISEIISKKGSTQKHVSLSGDVILSANGEGYKVKVYFGKFAEIPEGSILSIKKLSHDSGEYKSAQDAMIKTKKKADADFDKASLGLTALDITVSDAEGHTVEPKGKVGVRIEMDDMSKVADLPGTLDIDSLQVAHIKDNGAEILADTADKTKGSFDIAEDGSAVVTFNTASFSTYALVYQAMANQSDSSGTTRNMTVGDTQTLSGTTGSSYTVKVGETVTITPSDLSNGKKGNEYTWSSSSTSIATVTSGTSSTFLI